MKNFEQFKTVELVTIWNSVRKPIKKFADRKTAEKRVNDLLSDDAVVKEVLKTVQDRELVEKLSVLYIVAVPAAKNVVREDGRYNRTNPTFETDAERAAYVTTQYATKTDRFPGRKSQFAGCLLELTKEIASPFREGTVVGNSFQLIAHNPGISYEDFRIGGGRNTDLKAMVDKKIVKAKRSKRKSAA